MQLISKSTADTQKIGRAIAQNLKPADIICLFGELGSGKTMLTKGIAQGLGIKADKVISPTFVLLRQHLKANIPVYHFDLYRLKTPGDILALGYEEYLYGQGVSVIEWADRLACLMPREFLKIELRIKSRKERIINFSASGPRYKELLTNIDVYLNENTSP